MMLVYVAGPYRGDIDANIAAARRAAIKLWEAGFVGICPHLNTAHFEVDCSVREDTYLWGGIEILTRCDAIVMLPGWEESQGARGEYDVAKRIGLPISVYPELPRSREMTDRMPLRKVIGFMDKPQLELLECGHTQKLRRDLFNHPVITAVRRRCKKCLAGEPPDFDWPPKWGWCSHCQEKTAGSVDGLCDECRTLAFEATLQKHAKIQEDEEDSN
jgi:hypothetical protein